MLFVMEVKQVFYIKKGKRRQLLLDYYLMECNFVLQVCLPGPEFILVL